MFPLAAVAHRADPRQTAGQFSIVKLARGVAILLLRPFSVLEKTPLDARILPVMSPPAKNEATIAVIDSKTLPKVFGACDVNLRRIREALGVQVTVDGHQILLRGDADALRRGSHLLERLQKQAVSRELATEDIQRVHPSPV